MKIQAEVSVRISRESESHSFDLSLHALIMPQAKLCWGGCYQERDINFSSGQDHFPYQ